MSVVESAAVPPGRAQWLKPVFRTPPAADLRAAPVNAGPAQPVLHPLHLNESPYPPSPKAVEAIRAAAPTLNRYADATGRALAVELAARTGIAPSRIVFACGSEELIQVLCALAGGPGDEIVVPAPSFPSFALSVAQQGATPVRAAIDAGGANDAAAILRAIGARTRLAFCCTPNPPSGGMMTAEAVEAVGRGVPEHVMLAMDEAYHEFGRHAGGPDILAILARRRGPWVSLRTFSKAHGLAGVRLGYALCSDDAVADTLRRAKLHYGASVTAQAGALAALRDDAYLQRTLDAVAAERRRLSDGLRALGIAPFPSAGNFVSVRLPLRAVAAMAELGRRGILVRDWRDPDYLHEIRITVGLPADTEAVLTALRAIVAATA